MESEGPYFIDKDGYITGPTGKHDFVTLDTLKVFNSVFECGKSEGRKAEREYNWKAVAKMCGVNPYTHRPCIDKVEEKFWCPVCVCAGKIRGGQDGK